MEEDGNQQKLSCQKSDVWELFALYLSGDVTEEECKRIEQHLTICESCELLLDRLKHTTDMERQEAQQG